MSNQLIRAKVIVVSHLKDRLFYEEQLDMLDRVLGEAQTQPPEGTADGSITPEQWAKLQTLLKAARDYNDALVRAVEAIE